MMPRAASAPALNRNAEILARGSVFYCTLLKSKVPSHSGWVTYQPMAACLVQLPCNYGDADLKSLF